MADMETSLLDRVTATIADTSAVSAIIQDKDVSTLLKPFVWTHPRRIEDTIEWSGNAAMARPSLVPAGMRVRVHDVRALEERNVPGDKIYAVGR